MASVLEWDNFLTEFRSELYADNQCFDKLPLFLEKFKELYAGHKCTKSENSKRTSITVDRLQTFFSLFKPAINEYYRFGHGVNVWDVAGVGCDEMRNSAILSWLFDCNGSHGQGNIFLEGLLTWLSNHNDISSLARTNLPPPGSTHNVHYWTRVESLPQGEKESRVDIEIIGPFVLIIEVKINAMENGDQLKRYVDIAMKKAVLNKWGVIYLTRQGSKPTDVSLRENICNISWKQLISIIGSVVDRHLIKGSFVEHQIRQFCRHIELL